MWAPRPPIPAKAILEDDIPLEPPAEDDNPEEKPPPVLVRIEELAEQLDVLQRSPRLLNHMLH